MIFIHSCLLLVATANAAVPVFVEDAAEKVNAGFKRRGQRIHVETIVVEWQPADLVVDKSDIDLSQQIVQIQSGSSEWRTPEESPTPRRGKYRATFPVAPCLSHKIRFVVKSLQGEEGIYELPSVIGPASEEEIEKSRFTPLAPTNVRVTETGDGQVRVSWDGSECATSYEIYGIEEDVLTTEDVSIPIEGAKSCIDYEFAVSALTGEETSPETTVQFTTKPRVEDAQNLDVEIVPGVKSVSVSWDGWRSISCVPDYSVRLCQGETCFDPVTVPRSQFGSTKSHFSPEQELEECSEYEVHVKPMYNDLDLAAKIVSFNTLVPEIERMGQNLGPVVAQPEDGQMIRISWSPIKCASKYSVFQKSSGDWEPLDTVNTDTISVKAQPCTQYIYGVRAMLGSELTQIVETESPVEVALDASVPYNPSLITSPTEDDIILTWDHNICYQSYSVNICKLDDDCQDFPVEIPDPNQIININVYNHDVISFSPTSLIPCTEYKITIMANTKEGSQQSTPVMVSTKSPPSTPPTDFLVSIGENSEVFEVTFAPVACASAYKIYQSVGEGDMVLMKETTETRVDVAAPKACSQYSMAVSSVVDEVESGMSELANGKVLSGNSDTDNPELRIIKTENMTVQFVVQTPPANEKCEVESYEVKYVNLGTESEPVSQTLVKPEDDILTLDEVPGAGDGGMRLEARILYGDGVFSPWVSSTEPKVKKADGANGEESSSLLIPIIIGILVAIVIILVIVFVIIKRRRSQRKYDTESAQNEEESKKLKDNQS